MKKMKKNNKGFTLVEIIVVLVILAILAAAMIPAMLGYVEESRGKTYADQARVVYNAVQTCATEASALGASNDDIEAAINAYLAGDASSLEDNTAKSVAAKVRNLIGEDVLASEPSMQIKMDDDIDGHISQIWYDSNGTTEDGGYQVEINVATGTTNVQKDTAEGDKLIFTFGGGEAEGG